MDLELSGKTAIITGGSRGIGKAIARELALEGVDVVIVARRQEALEATATELRRASGRQVLPIAADTGVLESVQEMVRKASEALGHVDILVNAAAQPAGGSPPPKLAEITDDLVWAEMNVKVMGYLRCAREVTPHMLRQGWGRIILIGGMGARLSGSAINSMRNVALVAMAKNLADELGPHGVNVTVVHPGTTRTERTPGMIASQAARLGISEREAEQRMAEGNSVRKLIDAREIAYLVTFLASPKSIAINGDVIAAGGGFGRAIYY